MKNGSRVFIIIESQIKGIIRILVLYRYCSSVILTHITCLFNIQYDIRKM